MLRTPSRALVLGLAASLFLSALPLPAAAALGKVVLVAPANAGAGLGAAGLARSLPVSPASPTLSAPASGPATLRPAALAPVEGPRWVFNDDKPAQITAAVAAPPAAASALAAPADAPSARPVIAGVEAALTRIQSDKDGGSAASSVALDELFLGEARKAMPDDAPLASPTAALKDLPALAPASAKLAAPADGPRWVFTGEAKSGWKRTLSVGYITAVGTLILSGAVWGAAKLLGHVENSNYTDAADLLGSAPDLGGVLFFTFAVSVLAPVSEEIFFRAGIQGGLSKLTKSLRLGAFWIPAVVSSVLFVAVHETSDPVLFAVRMVLALTLAYVYQKEGLLAAISAHAFFNGITALQLLPFFLLGMLPAGAALGLGLAAAGTLALAAVMTKAGAFVARRLRKLYSVPLIGLGALVLLVAGLAAFFAPDPAIQASIGLALAILSGLLYAAAKAYGYLKAQRPDVASGAVVPKAFTLKHGVLSAVLLAVGFFLMMQNLIWLAALVGIAPWIAYKTFKHLKA